MDRQATFDKAATAVIAQGQRAYSDDYGLCMYRTPCGNKCAVGHLLPDDAHPSLLSYKGSVRSLLSSYPQVGVMLGVDGRADEDFLHDLQTAHDNAKPRYEVDGFDFVATYKDNMRGVARSYNLNPEVVA